MHGFVSRTDRQVGIVGALILRDSDGGAPGHCSICADRPAPVVNITIATNRRVDEVQPTIPVGCNGEIWIGVGLQSGYQIYRSTELTGGIVAVGDGRSRSGGICTGIGLVNKMDIIVAVEVGPGEDRAQTIVSSDIEW